MFIYVKSNVILFLSGYYSMSKQRSNWILILFDNIHDVLSRNISASSFSLSLLLTWWPFSSTPVHCLSLLYQRAFRVWTRWFVVWRSQIKQLSTYTQVLLSSSSYLKFEKDLKQDSRITESFCRTIRDGTCWSHSCLSQRLHFYLILL